MEETNELQNAVNEALPNTEPVAEEVTEIPNNEPATPEMPETQETPEMQEKTETPVEEPSVEEAPVETEPEPDYSNSTREEYRKSRTVSLPSATASTS